MSSEAADIEILCHVYFVENDSFAATYNLHLSKHSNLEETKVKLPLWRGNCSASTEGGRGPVRSARWKIALLG